MSAGGTLDLFAALTAPPPRSVELAAGAVLLRGQAGDTSALADAITAVVARSPWRHMHTPGGGRMSVAMSSCGAAGWISDLRGYRYAHVDPLSGEPWPSMPDCFAQLATESAATAGYADFIPDACLINRYLPGASMGLHQDRNEPDLQAPIVSVSLGGPAVFLFGGARRTDPRSRTLLHHGDVVVWGGPARLNFHGVSKLQVAQHPFAADARINLTFRKAL
jgi:alkylated DNA repair protein (DNA oxidative demethylase)